MRVHFIPWGAVMGKKNPSSDEAKLQATEPVMTDADMGDLNPSSDEASADLGDLNNPAVGTADLGKLPPLAKFKKFQKKGK